MSAKSDSPIIDEALLDESLQEEEPGVPGEGAQQEDEIAAQDFDFMAAARELQGLADRLFKRADKVNSPRLANALELKADKLTTEGLKFQGWAKELPENTSLESLQRMLINLRAEAQELLEEKDAKPSSQEILSQPDPNKTWTFNEVNQWRDQIDYEPLLQRAQEPLEPSELIIPLGESAYVDEPEELELAAGQICPFCKQKITRKEVSECKGEGNEGLLLKYGDSYYHCECWLRDLLIHAAGDCLQAAQKFHAEHYLGELRAYKMSWRINYGAFGATSPRAGLPLPDPAKVSADRDRSVA
jgi:hypothetical protein